MGDMADDLTDRVLNAYNEEFDCFDPPDEPMWETRGGDLVRIKDMEDSHLINTIKMLRRKDEEGIELYTHLVNELTVRKLTEPNASRG